MSVLFILSRKKSANNVIFLVQKYRVEKYCSSEMLYLEWTGTSCDAVALFCRHWYLYQYLFKKGTTHRYGVDSSYKLSELAE